MRRVKTFQKSDIKCYGTVTYSLMDSSKPYINQEPSSLVVGMNRQPVVETGYSTD